LGLGGIGQEEGNDAPPLIRSDSQHYGEKGWATNTKSIGPNWMGERRHLGQEGVKFAILEFFIWRLSIMTTCIQTCLIWSLTLWINHKE
jgi:hypothetical protein